MRISSVIDRRIYQPQAKSQESVESRNNYSVKLKGIAMADKLKGKVGFGVRQSLASDTIQVLSLLNIHIQCGALNHVSPLSTSSRGDSPDVIAAIREFQTKVVRLKKPDGRVDPGGKTIKALRNVPKSSGQSATLLVHATLNLVQGPVGDVPHDLWNIGLQSFMGHANHPSIKKSVIMFVDFRKSNAVKRLWMVDLASRIMLLCTRVSHGAGYVSGKGVVVTASRFSNVSKSYDSSVGGYATLQETRSRAGHLGERADGSKKSGIAAIIDGLDSTNNRAKHRNIIIHGASYVNQRRAGNSQGCFATHPNDNQQIVQKMKNGGFIYAYAGEAYRTKL